MFIDGDGDVEEIDAFRTVAVVPIYLVVVSGTFKLFPAKFIYGGIWVAFPYADSIVNPPAIEDKFVLKCWEEVIDLVDGVVYDGVYTGGRCPHGRSINLEPICVAIWEYIMVHNDL